MPQVLTAVLKNHIKRAWDLHEHQAECEPMTCSHHRYSKLHTLLHYSLARQPREANLPLSSTAEAAPGTSSLGLGLRCTAQEDEADLAHPAKKMLVRVIRLQQELRCDKINCTREENKAQEGPVWEAQAGLCKMFSQGEQHSTSRGYQRGGWISSFVGDTTVPAPC